MNHTAMKTTATAQPRLTCRIARAWSAWREDDTTRPAPGLAARHAADCPDCAQHFAALSALENALRQEARTAALAAQAQEVPLGLEDRIWGAVRPIVREPARVRRAAAWRRWVPALGAVAGALAVAAVLWNEPNRVASGEDITFTQDDLRQLTASIETLSQKVLNAPTVESVAARQPDALTAELNALRSDGRAALRFLERSFLPSDMQLGTTDAPTEVSG